MNEALGETFGPLVDWVWAETLLAAVYKDGVHQEEDAVDDGNGSLSKTVVAKSALAQVLEVLDGQGAGGDEQGATQQTEVDVL